MLLTSKASNKESLITKQIQNVKQFLKKNKQKGIPLKTDAIYFRGVQFWIWDLPADRSSVK